MGERIGTVYMRVRLLDTPNNKRDINQFVAFPFALYQHCPQWVPPLVSDARRLLSWQHPYYAHSHADFYLVESEGQVLGRMALLENRRYNDYQKKKAAFFGYFDVVDDESAAHALFKTAFNWARARGLNEILGPRGLIGIDGSVLVEGFAHRPAMGIPYNYPYYDRLIRAAGFVKDTDYLSGYARADVIFPPRVYEIAEKIKAQRGFRIKSFTSRQELRAWVPRVMPVHQEAMGQLHTFYPPTEAEVRVVVNTLLTIADPHLIKLVMKGEEIVGFIIAYHDISAGLQRARGRLFPLGWWHILRERRRTRRLNVNGLGLLPAYRGLGANAMLYTELLRTVQQYHFEHVEVVQVNEANFASRSDMETLGADWYKRHRHYRLML